jgi:multidrug efflux pump subunit AcrA (membrane-fusion protein)
MIKQLILLTLCTLALNAKNVILTAEQEENWKIKSELPESSNSLPLGDFIVEVVTPPMLLHTISLPFEANIQRLHVANLQAVTQGDILADVTGKDWIETQQKAISDAIELKHNENLLKRKSVLCKEEVIPQKECLAFQAELQTMKVKVAASRALLKSYGASDDMLSRLLKDLVIFQTIPVRSTVDGHIVKLNATPGKSVNPSDALFVIQKKGQLWIESAIETERTQSLNEGEKVNIVLDGQTFDTTILQLSPVINPENQTRSIRFLVPSDVNIFAGQRSNAKVILPQECLKIKKNAVIKIDEDQIVFTKNKTGYTAVPVKILAEDEMYYFIKVSADLKNSKIAVSSVAVLKNMMGSDDE